MKWENDTFGLVLRMRQMVYSSKDFESLWFLYQAEGLPKNISIEEFLDKPSEQVRALHKARSSCLGKRAELERTIQLSTNGTGRRIRRSIQLRLQECQLTKRLRFRRKLKR